MLTALRWTALFVFPARQDFAPWRELQPPDAPEASVSGGDIPQAVQPQRVSSSGGPSLASSATRDSPFIDVIFVLGGNVPSSFADSSRITRPSVRFHSGPSLFVLPIGLSVIQDTELDRLLEVRKDSATESRFMQQSENRP